MRIKKVIGVGVMVGGLGVAAAACGPVNIHWETYPTGTTGSLHTAEQHWWVNGGGDAAIYVNKTQVTATGDVFDALYSGKAPSTYQADGRALAKDAAAAARNPYPGNT